MLRLPSLEATLRVSSVMGNNINSIVWKMWSHTGSLTATWFSLIEYTSTLVVISSICKST